jgi:hypothetical protein
MYSLANTLGHAIGPFTMAIMSHLKYPGLEIGSTGLHLNLYSAPTYLLILTIIVSVILLIFWFDGKMRLLKSPSPINSEIVEENKAKGMLFIEMYKICLFFQLQ